MRIARRSQSSRPAVRSGSLGYTIAWILCAAIGAGCGTDPAPTTSPAPVKESLPATTAAADSTGAAPAAPAEAPKPAADPATTAAAANTAADPGKAPEPGKAADPGKAAAAPSPTAAVDDPKLAAATAAPAETAAPTATAAATAAPADTAAPTVMSPKLAEGTFNLWMQSAKSYKVGQQGSVEVVLVAKGDYKCNDKYPFKFKLGAPPAGVSYPQAVIPAGSMSIGTSRSSMRVPFIPSAPGDARISGKFSFSVCSAERCVVESRELAVNVKVVE